MYIINEYINFMIDDVTDISFRSTSTSHGR